MTFEEAFDRLNTGDYTAVAREMANWHPRILGDMLIAVQVAKSVRYPRYHPHYYESLVACLAVQEETSITMPTSSTLHSLKADITMATLRLQKG
jgi:hypothetical protein